MIERLKSKRSIAVRTECDKAVGGRRALGKSDDARADRRLRIAVVTTGRFHVLDLARELVACGHDVVFWSILPRGRAVRFGLPTSAHRGLLTCLWPLVAAQRYGGRHLRTWVNPMLVVAADRIVARRLEACDVFIGMSGICVSSARAVSRASRMSSESESSGRGVSNACVSNSLLTRATMIKLPWYSLLARRAAVGDDGLGLL